MSFSFCEISKKFGATQSGISQQISKLEDQIGSRLFRRINKQVLLNEIGKRLVRYIDKYLDGMDDFFEDILKMKPRNLERNASNIRFVFYENTLGTDTIKLRESSKAWVAERAHCVGQK